MRSRKFLSLFPWIIAGLLALLLLVLIRIGWWQGTAVGPQVQVPMFYDAHYLFPRAWTQEQEAPGVPEDAPLAFYGPNRVSQPFISGMDNLAVIEVWLAGEPDQIVAISVTSDEGEVFSGEQPLFKGIPGGYYQFTFPAVANSKGRQFLFTMSAPGAVVEEPVVTRTVGGDRLGGSLHLNEYNRPGNLALASYARGSPGQWWVSAVGEQIFPAIFRLRLQQYKPEFFKGNFFLLVLVFTVVLSIVYLFLARPQKRPSVTNLQSALGWTLVIILGLFLLWQIGTGRVKLPIFQDAAVLAADEQVLALAPPPGSANRLIDDIISDLWTLDREPEARFTQTELINGLPAVRVPQDSSITANIDVAPGSILGGGVLAKGKGELGFNLRVNGESVYTQELTAASDPQVQDIVWFDVDLSPWAGQPATVELLTSSDSRDLEGLWIMPQILNSSPWLLSDLPESVKLLPELYQFGESAALIGESLDRQNYRAGDTVLVDLFWRSLQRTDQYAKVFVHLLDPEGNLIAQQDGQPVQNAYPLPNWQPGAIIQDSHVLSLPANLLPGEYQLRVGLYDPETLQRWVVTAANGSNYPDDAVLLQSRVEVRP